MTDKQPEALRLAYELDKHVFYGDQRILNWKRHSPLAMNAAAELRRLHEVNAELVEALEYVIKGVPCTWTGVTKAKIVLEKLKGNNNG